MKIKFGTFIAITLLMAATVLAQESGFIISMKNGSRFEGEC